MWEKGINIENYYREKDINHKDIGRQTMLFLDKGHWR